MGSEWVRYCTMVMVLMLLFPLQSFDVRVEAGDGWDDVPTPASTTGGFVLRPPETPPEVEVTRTDGIPMSPVLVMDGEGTVHAVWVDGFNHHKREVRYSRSTDGGRNWSTSLAISSNLTTSADMPDLAVGNDGTVAVTWTETQPSDVQCYARWSRDGGTTFGPIELVEPLPGYTGCTGSRAVSVPGTGIILVVMNRAWEMLNRDQHGIGWCLLAPDGGLSQQHTVLDLGWSRGRSVATACPVGPHEIDILYVHNKTPYMATVDIDDGAVTSTGLPLFEDYRVDEGHIEALRWDGRSYYVMVSYRSYVTRLSLVYAREGESGPLNVTLIRHSSSRTTMDLLDAVVTGEGHLQVLVDNLSDDSLFIAEWPLPPGAAGGPIVTLYEDVYMLCEGGSVVPMDGEVNSALVATPQPLGGDHPSGFEWVIECIRWNWSSMGRENLSFIGSSTHYVSDRTDLHVACGHDGTVHAVWSEPRSYTPDYYYVDDCDIMYSRRIPGRAGFEPPVKLNTNASNRPCWGMLDVAVSTDGTVYVAWLSYAGEASWVVSHRLEGTLSRDNGTTWSQPRLFAVGKGMDSIPTWMDWRHLQMAAAPNGTMFLSFVYDWEALGLYVYGIVLDVVAWKDDFQLFLNIPVEGAIPSRYPRPEDMCNPSLVVSASGNPHIVYEYRDSTPERNYTVKWLRSLDGGFTWETPETVLEGTEAPVRHNPRAALVSDDALVVALTDTGMDARSLNTSLHWCMRDLVSNTTSYVEVLDNSSHLRPIEGMLGVMDDGNTSTIYFLAHEGIVTPGEDLFYRATLASVQVDHNGTVRGPQVLSRIPVRSRFLPGSEYPEYPYVSFDMFLETSGAPVIGSTLVGDAAGRLKAFIWRANHLPSLTPASEAMGGWTFGPGLSLAVEDVTDPDGDDLEYLFRIWSPDGEYNVSSGWRTSASFRLDGLDHGEYCWSVEVRDPFGSAGPVPGWWFRYDAREPSADAGGPYLTVEGSPVLLSGVASSDDGPITLYEWDLDGDGVFEHASRNATVAFQAVDDFRGNVTLRVTDEAGRQATAVAFMVVDNEPPGVVIEGRWYVEAGQTVQYTAVVTDQGVEDEHTVTWYGKGGETLVGTSVEVEFPFPGDVVLAVRVEDDDGGAVYVQRTVTVKGKPLEIVIQHPDFVWLGEEYRAYITDNYPLPLETLNVTWYLDGEVIGTGREIWRTEEVAGDIELSVMAEDPDGNWAKALGTIRARERLESVMVLTPLDFNDTTITIIWSMCRQAQAFERYEVVISTEPITSPPNSHDDWQWAVNPRTERWFTSQERETTLFTFTDLGPDTTYYIRVDVVGDGQRSFSNVYAVRTLATPLPPDEASPDAGNGEWTVPGLSMLVALLLVVLITATATAMYIRYREGLDRENQ